MKIQTVKFPRYSESTHRTIDVSSIVSPERVKIVRDFGVTDLSGRVVGAYVKTFIEVYRNATTEELVEGDENNRYGADYIRLSRVPAGTYYSFTPYATRAGAHFGASQPSNTYATKSDRDAAVEEYFTAAQKRAIKAWAPK